MIERQFPVTYGSRGLSLDSEGDNRNVNVAIPTLPGRRAADPLTPDDPDLLPGQTDVAAPDGPDNEVNHRLFVGFRAAGGSHRPQLWLFPGHHALCMPRALAGDLHASEREPTASDTVVAYPTSVSLAPNTDLYFRGFDNQFPDYYRYKEWERDFDTRYAAPEEPNSPP